MTKANAAAILIINGLAAVGTTIAAFRFDSQTLHGYMFARFYYRPLYACVPMYLTILAAKCRDRVMFVYIYIYIF